MVQIHAGSDPFPEEPEDHFHQHLIRILESMFTANTAAEHGDTAAAVARWATVKSAEVEAIQEWSSNSPEAVQ